MTRRIASACVFCGSSHGADPAFVQAARELGRLLAGDRIQLVYGGGNVGLMGEIADATMASAGRVVGVIPQSLESQELAHRSITELHIVDSMHARKAMMADLSEAFIALPGGFGTIEEFCEIITWSQLGFHRKPCVLLNIAGYYDPLLQQFDQGVERKFIKSAHRAAVLSANRPADVLDMLRSFQPSDVTSRRRPGGR